MGDGGTWEAQNGVPKPGDFANCKLAIACLTGKFWARPATHTPFAFAREAVGNRARYCTSAEIRRLQPKAARNQVSTLEIHVHEPVFKHIPLAPRETVPHRPRKMCAARQPRAQRPRANATARGAQGGSTQASVLGSVQSLLSAAAFAARFPFGSCGAVHPQLERLNPEPHAVPCQQVHVCRPTSIGTTWAIAHSDTLIEARAGSQQPEERKARQRCSLDARCVHVNGMRMRIRMREHAGALLTGAMGAATEGSGSTTGVARRAHGHCTRASRRRAKVF